MDKKVTNKEKIIIIISAACLIVIDFFRRYFIWTEIFIDYSILMSFLMGIFTVILEYVILKRWIKNKKLLMAFLIILSILYFIGYALKIKGVI